MGGKLFARMEGCPFGMIGDNEFMMKITAPVDDNGMLAPGFGRARKMAIATFEEKTLVDYEVIDVGWDILHDEGPHGSHHGRIVRFLKEHDIDRVLCAGMGESMAHTINKMGLPLFRHDPIDIRQALDEVAAYPVDR